MIVEDKFGLRPIWDEIFGIYKVVAEICDRHGLRYYATDGTAIGAVRHKGYIPWDDDFDISMPRPDYDKFIKIAKDELPNHLKFLNWQNTPEFFFLFGKVQDCRKEHVLDVEKKVGYMLSNGIYIDIFPVDGYPTNKLECLWTKYSTVILKCIIRFRCMKLSQQASGKGRLAWIIGCLVSCIVPFVTASQCMAYCERRLRLASFDKCEFTGRTCSSLTVFRRAPLEKSAWGRPTPHEFHDGTVMLPENYDAHLKNEYPKRPYMTMPPEELRRPAHGYGWRCSWWIGPTRE